MSTFVWTPTTADILKGGGAGPTLCGVQVQCLAVGHTRPSYCLGPGLYCSPGSLGGLSTRRCAGQQPELGERGHRGVLQQGVAEQLPGGLGGWGREGAGVMLCDAAIVQSWKILVSTGRRCSYKPGGCRDLRHTRKPAWLRRLTR